jgi:uncharacterized protein with NRDE domain
MCLIALAYGVSKRFSMVIAANRDEALDRPTAPLAAWQSSAGHTIIGGRDLQDGGTWMGFTPQGRFAMITNVRDPQAQPPAQAISRGRLALSWLESQHDAPGWIAQQDLQRYAGFNMILGDCTAQPFFYLTTLANFQRFKPFAQVKYREFAMNKVAYELPPGQVYGLSNAALQTPWPKTIQLTQALAQAIQRADAAEQTDDQALSTLQQDLLTALQDRTPVPLEALPQTGVSLELEQALATAFVRYPTQAPRYGTRTSLVAALDSHSQLQVLELSHAQADRAAQRHHISTAWPAAAPSTRPPI